MTTFYCRATEILRKRIKREFRALLNNSRKDMPLLRDTLVLDLETYYTVAEDFLKLIETFYSKDKKAEFKKEKAYKTICILRNYLIRHSYDKPEGDPYVGFAWNPTKGPWLKGGSPFANFSDPGFYSNDKALYELLERYRVRELVQPKRPK